MVTKVSVYCVGLYFLICFIVLFFCRFTFQILWGYGRQELIVYKPEIKIQNVMECVLQVGLAESIIWLDERLDCIRYRGSYQLLKLSTLSHQICLIFSWPHFSHVFLKRSYCIYLRLATWWCEIHSSICIVSAPVGKHITFLSSHIITSLWWGHLNST